ncbi:hypothetical protein D9M68_852280 [compost metagenome]
MNQITENSSTAENLARSAKAPTISATVMAAKVPWKAKNTYSGIVVSAPKVSCVMPFMKILSKLPKKLPSPVKARL